MLDQSRKTEMKRNETKRTKRPVCSKYTIILCAIVNFWFFSVHWMLTLLHISSAFHSHFAQSICCSSHFTACLGITIEKDKQNTSIYTKLKKKWKSIKQREAVVRFMRHIQMKRNRDGTNETETEIQNDQFRNIEINNKFMWCYLTWFFFPFYSTDTKTYTNISMNRRKKKEREKWSGTSCIQMVQVTWIRIQQKKKVVALL